MTSPFFILPTRLWLGHIFVPQTCWNSNTLAQQTDLSIWNNQRCGSWFRGLDWGQTKTQNRCIYRMVTDRSCCVSLSQVVSTRGGGWWMYMWAHSMEGGCCLILGSMVCLEFYDMLYTEQTVFVPEKKVYRPHIPVEHTGKKNHGVPPTEHVLALLVWQIFHLFPLSRLIKITSF